MVTGLSATIIRRLRNQMAKSSKSTARERAIARAGKKGQKGPLARILSKSRTGKPSPHVDPPKRKRMTSDDYKKFLDKYAPKPKKIRKTTPMKKGGPADKRDPGFMKRMKPGAKQRDTYTTTFHKSKEAAKKDKGKLGTPGEKMRTIRGKIAAGKARTKKVLRGGFDIGKKIRYQRRGK
tara:strand:- start:415 stop:951 length:537 start_codon:yes stop_codon:yes gene_type:complete